MIVCKNCGAENPDTSLYCQDCGSRIGGGGEPAAPPAPATPASGVARGSTVSCPRCGTGNATHLRFCNHCGYDLGGAAPASPAASAPAAPAAEPAGRGTVCWRCFGVGDPGAEFCKFCGARYADAPAAPGQRAAPAAPAVSPSPVAPAAPAAPAPRAGVAGGRLVSILKDGSDGRAYAIQVGTTDIGRHEGDIVLDDDPYLSPRHARLTLSEGRGRIVDLDSVNGVYVRLRSPVGLHHGDRILLGQQVLVFEILADPELPLGPASQQGALVFGTPEVPRVARLVQYTTEGLGRDVHYLYRDETVIGREQGDVVFTDDPFMSRRHASIRIDRAQKRFTLTDLGSSNGTAIRIRGEAALASGEQFRVGRHLFRFEAEARGGREAR